MTGGAVVSQERTENMERILATIAHGQGKITSAMIRARFVGDVTERTVMRYISALALQGRIVQNGTHNQSPRWKAAEQQ